MASFPVAYRVAQAVGFTGAAWLSGNIAALSAITMPALIQCHKDDQLSTIKTVRLWKAMFDRGKSQNPPIAAATTSAFFYLAWSVRSGTSLYRLARPNASALYGLAAVLTIGIVPYTLVTMTPTNNALIAKAESKTADASSHLDTEVEGLFRKWSSLNAGRSLFPLTAGLVGIFTALF